MIALPERLHIQDLVSIALVILIAQQLAGITWTLVSGPAGTPAVAVGQADPGGRATTDPERIASRHLFGRVDARPARIETIDAPETRLNLQLRGIIAASDRSGSRVLISGPGGDERVYAPGASVPGGATVHEILPDRVLLNRRGTLETLRLPKPGEGEAASPQRASAPIPVDNLRDAGLATDGALAEIVRPQAVMVDGNLHGFRIYPGRDRQRFAALGLRAGDLVTAIDGIEMNDAIRGTEALQALAGSGRVSLTVQRGGQTETIEVELPQ